MCDAAVLVLLMGVIYEVYRGDGLRRHGIHTEFHEDWLRHSRNINVTTSNNLRSYTVGTTKRGRSSICYVYEIVQ
jgi:hypothetical protein